MAVSPPFAHCRASFFLRDVLSFLLLLSPIVLAPSSARADTLDEIRKRGTLIWGADEAGGAPYVFSENGMLRGFEVDLAMLLAAELGVQPQFQQGEWKDLPSLLDNRTIDIVLNGYELTAQRKRLFRVSRPYYYYGLQLLARADGPVQSWADLTGSEGVPLTVGALTGSAAETYLKTACGSHVTVKSYDGSIEAMERVVDRAETATLQDDCIAIYYADRYPALRFIGRPVSEGHYVALMRADDERLQAAIDTALATIIRDGRLKEIYDRWDLGGRTQELALRDVPQLAAAGERSGWLVVGDNLGILLQAAGMTVLLSVASMPLAIGLGILIAVGRMYGPRPLAFVLALYVEVIRGTPLMLQLFAIFFLLPKLGFGIEALPAAIAGLAINYSAYEAEIYRAGLQAIPRGQMEAALALGMSRGQGIRRIVLPQAVRVVIPPVTNDFIALFKDTSVCSVVTVVELTKRYNVLATSTGAVVELAIVTAILYLLMSYPLSLVARWNERRLAGVAAR